MTTPDEQVATSIVIEFRRLGLLGDKTLENLAPKLSSGSLSPIDWKLLFEIERPGNKEAK